MSTGPYPGLESYVVRLQQHLSHYVQRKAGFPDHPRMSPARARRLLDRLGRPDEGQTLVWVVGTKGKGSTAAILEAVLREGGLTTGLYTSPHLHSPRERIRVNGRPIGRPAFGGLLRQLLPLLQQSLSWDDLGPATLFEGLTALAMAHFALHGAEIAVVEAGMGGRSDATRALSPALTLLTPIALDHQQYLGNSLEAIANEKVGGIAPGGIVLSAPQPGQVWAVVKARCEEIAAVLRRIGPGRTMDLALSGPHQVENAELALAGVAMLRELGWTVPDSAVREGLRSVHWPGRLEVVAGRPTTIVDGAHNPAAAQALAEALGEPPTGPEPPRRRLILVLGCSSDKDLEGIVSALAPLAEGAIATKTAHYRSADPAELAELWKAQGVPARTAGDVLSAVRDARGWAGRAGQVCVTGSFFIVAEAREALGLAVREPWPTPVLGTPSAGA
jgi:dihydrofolate synthase/folylpolyglutamate synthase